MTLDERITELATQSIYSREQVEHAIVAMFNARLEARLKPRPDWQVERMLWPAAGLAVSRGLALSLVMRQLDIVMSEPYTGALT